MARNFADWLKAFLEETRQGLGEHVSVFFRYGIESFVDFEGLDEGCIEELRAELMAANVKAFHANQIKKRLLERLGQNIGTLHGPTSGPPVPIVGPLGPLVFGSSDFVEDNDFDFELSCGGGSDSDQWMLDGDVLSGPTRTRKRPRTRAGKNIMQASTSAQNAGRKIGESPIEPATGKSHHKAGFGGQRKLMSASAGTAHLFANRGRSACSAQCENAITEQVCKCDADAAVACVGDLRCAVRQKPFLQGAVCALRAPKDMAAHVSSKYARAH
jgi:hypothetical protein